MRPDRGDRAEGGRIILMAAGALPPRRRGPEDYIRVYDRVLSQVRKAGDHSLGSASMFDPALEATGQWRPHGAMKPASRSSSACRKGRRHQDFTPSKEKEIVIGGNLPKPCACIPRRLQLCRTHRRRRGRASDAAARHLRRHRAGGFGRRWKRWGSGRNGQFFELLEPTVPLSRHIFKAPTRFY